MVTCCKQNGNLLTTSIDLQEENIQQEAAAKAYGALFLLLEASVRAAPIASTNKETKKRKTKKGQKAQDEAPMLLPW